MQQKLSAARKSKLTGYAITCRDNDCKLLGWSLLWQGDNSAGITMPVVYIYVRKSARRRGVASRLMYGALRAAKDYLSADTVGVWAHDDAACAFYSRFGSRVVMYW